MKKLFIFFLAAQFLAIGMAACNNGETRPDDKEVNCDSIERRIALNEYFLTNKEYIADSVAYATDSLIRLRDSLCTH